MKTYGLIGKKLGHSFSKRYFTEKFAREGIADAQYELFELADIAELPELLAKRPDIAGLNVTIPYKEAVMPLLHGLDETARRVGAVNVIKRFPNGQLWGYNSDCLGFEASLLRLLPAKPFRALVLGSGGAAKAVAYILGKLEIPFDVVSRDGSAKHLGENANYRYESLTEALVRESLLLVNTTPLGMYPNTETLPPIPYEGIGKAHVLYDLVYNPENTAFMMAGEKRDALSKNGLEMLHGQAEAAWAIWGAATAG